MKHCIFSKSTVSKAPFGSQKPFVESGPKRGKLELKVFIWFIEKFIIYIKYYQDFLKFSTKKTNWNFFKLNYRQSGWLCTRWGEIAQSLNFKYLNKRFCKSNKLLWGFKGYSKLQSPQQSARLAVTLVKNQGWSNGWVFLKTHPPTGFLGGF